MNFARAAASFGIAPRVYSVAASPELFYRLQKTEQPAGQKAEGEPQIYTRARGYERALRAYLISLLDKKGEQTLLRIEAKIYFCTVWRELLWYI